MADRDWSCWGDYFRRDDHCVEEVNFEVLNGRVTALGGGGMITNEHPTTREKELSPTPSTGLETRLETNVVEGPLVHFRTQFVPSSNTSLPYPKSPGREREEWTERQRALADAAPRFSNVSDMAAAVSERRCVHLENKQN